METIDLFLQAEGIDGIEVVTLEASDSVLRLREVAYSKGLPFAERHFLFVDISNTEADSKTNAMLILDEAVSIRTISEIGLTHECHVHIHRHSTVLVTVNYLSKQHVRDFKPSATVGDVLHWATDKFGIDEIEATEFGLFLCARPRLSLEETTHLGRLTETDSNCLCFDLGPKHRVQGQHSYADG